MRKKDCQITDLIAKGSGPGDRMLWRTVLPIVVVVIVVFGEARL